MRSFLSPYLPTRASSATDTSPSQISNAPSIPNVEFMVGDAHDTRLPGGGADLVTIAQALHWLDRPRFYVEVARLLKPGGTFAILTYDFGRLRYIPDPLAGSAASKPAPSSDEADRELNSIWDFGFNSKGLGPYWAAPRKLVDEQYKGPILFCSSRPSVSSPPSHPTHLCHRRPHQISSHSSRPLRALRERGLT